MNQEEARKTALKILDESHVGVLSTIKDDKPHSRYMTFFNEDFTLFTATSKQTQKVDELESNPNAHILLGYEGEGFGDAFLEIEGEMKEHDDPETLENLWNDHLKGWFKGPDDPDLLMLSIKPTRARLMNKKGQSPISLDL